jgi:hypothetical protein
MRQIEKERKKTMAHVKDIATKKMAGKNPGGTKKLNKEQKKQLERAQKQAFVLSSSGQIAATFDGTHKHIVIREDKLNEALKNMQQGLGFVVNPDQEVIEFSKKHQEVLTVMSKLDYEELGRDQFDSDEDYELHVKIVKRNADLFDDIDQFTFKFSEGMMKGKGYRKQIMEEYKEFREAHPEIEEVLKSKVVEAKVV